MHDSMILLRIGGYFGVRFRVAAAAAGSPGKCLWVKDRRKGRRRSRPAAETQLGNGLAGEDGRPPHSKPQLVDVIISVITHNPVPAAN